jgi:hypothetical protein
MLFWKLTPIICSKGINVSNKSAVSIFRVAGYSTKILVTEVYDITHQVTINVTLSLGEENVKHMLPDCLENINWGKAFLNKGRLNMNKEIAYRKILRFR